MNIRGKQTPQIDAHIGTQQGSWLCQRGSNTQPVFKEAFFRLLPGCSKCAGCAPSRLLGQPVAVAIGKGAS